MKIPVSVSYEHWYNRSAERSAMLRLRSARLNRHPREACRARVKQTKESSLRIRLRSEGPFSFCLWAASGVVSTRGSFFRGFGHDSGNVSPLPGPHAALIDSEPEACSCQRFSRCCQEWRPLIAPCQFSGATQQLVLKFKCSTIHLNGDLSLKL